MECAEAVMAADDADSEAYKALVTDKMKSGTKGRRQAPCRSQATGCRSCSDRIAP